MDAERPCREDSRGSAGGADRALRREAFFSAADSREVREEVSTRKDGAGRRTLLRRDVWRLAARPRQGFFV